MRRRDLALSVAFLAAITFPLATAPLAGSLESEQRRAAPLPPLPRDFAALSTWPAAFQEWVNDHFGARSHLIRWRSAANYRLLGLSSSPDVAIGSDGFLHYQPELRAHLPGTEFTPAQLEGWRRWLERERDALAARGIRYRFLVAPDKSTLYPETVRGARWQRPVSRLDQLLAHLRGRSTVEVIDPRDRLRALAATALVYERTDTHWNERGAQAAAAAVAESEGLETPRFAVTQVPGGGGDLARMLSLPALLREQRPHLTPEPPLPAPRGKLLLLHDSFGARMIPFLALAFSEVKSAVGRSPEPRTLETLRPDLVVEELVERDLISDPPPGLPPPPAPRPPPPEHRQP